MQALSSAGSQVVMIPLSDLTAFGEGIAQTMIDKFMANREESYLTTKQAAKRIGVDPSTLYRWEKERYLTPVRLGSKRRYKQSDIDRILNARQ